MFILFLLIEPYFFHIAKDTVNIFVSEKLPLPQFFF